MDRILVPILYLKDGRVYHDMDLAEPFDESITKAADLQERRGADALLIFDYSYDTISQKKALFSIREICEAVDIPVWVGGNILCLEDAENYYAAGAAVVVLDEERISNVDLMEELVRRHGGDHVALLHIPGGNDSLYEAAANHLAFVVSPGIPDNTPGGLNYLFLQDKANRTVTVETLQKRNALGLAGQFLTESDETFWQMKRELREDGIAVHTLDPAMPFTEFKLDEKGLIPCVVQDNKTNEVLMVAYMNEEAFRKTCETGLATYFSRSRQELWTKGMTSGHLQYVKRMYVDCDSDTLLLKVKQIGGACHTGHRTCFYRTILET
ncbi:MAG: phosphoribosyl-AMP cyclohydrolase [Lachnospiraceae bacterium]|jgi:phosphoribosyl-ATP pyrophosphohydrolase/phosphoribosyl-AMP cyclohydrolase